MNADTIKSNILRKQAWLERALIALDEAKLWHNEQDAQSGGYMVRWIQSQRKKNVPLGSCLTGDLWPGRARHLAQQYVPELMALALTRAKADAEKYAALAKDARQRVRKLERELKKFDVLEATTERERPRPPLCNGTLPHQVQAHADRRYGGGGWRAEVQPSHQLRRTASRPGAMAGQESATQPEVTQR
jgi:hypothetical protein